MMIPNFHSHFIKQWVFSSDAMAVLREIWLNKVVFCFNCLFYLRQGSLIPLNVSRWSADYSNCSVISNFLAYFQFEYLPHSDSPPAFSRSSWWSSFFFNCFFLHRHNRDMPCNSDSPLHHHARHILYYSDSPLDCQTRFFFPL